MKEGVIHIFRTDLKRQRSIGEQKKFSGVFLCRFLPNITGVNGCRAPLMPVAQENRRKGKSNEGKEKFISIDKTNVRHQFDRLYHLVRHGEAANCYRHMDCHRKHEITFSELTKDELSRFYTVDEYDLDTYQFQVLSVNPIAEIFSLLVLQKCLSISASVL